MIDEPSVFLDQLKEFSLYSETNLDGIITDVSKSFCDICGYTREELIGQKHSILKHPKEDTEKYTSLWETISKGDTWNGELRCIDKNGDEIWYDSIIFPKINTNGETIGYAAMRYDMTEKKLAEANNITDELTGLHNRRYFNQIFLDEKSRAKRDSKSLIFMMIDIDCFKNYNDTYGHLQGDIALKKVADILKNYTKRVQDFAFRLGGEEFGILTTNFSKKEVLQYAYNLKSSVEKLQMPNQKSPHKYLTISIGICTLEPIHDIDCEEIYDIADKALYKAKNNGRNQFAISEEHYFL